MQEVKIKSASSLLTNRLPEKYKTNKKFLDGDHWQEGEGYLALPPIGVPNRDAILEKIKQGFTSENQFEGIVETHLDGILAREPDYDLVDKTAKESDDEENADQVEDESHKEAITAIIEWWSSRKMLDLLREALSLALVQERCVIRAFVPSGYVDDNGNIQKQKTLAAALEMLQFEVIQPDVGGVFKDKETYKSYGIFIKTEGLNKKIELTYLDDDGNTCLRVIEQETLREFAEKTFPQFAAYMPPEGTAPPPEIEPINLNKNLLMFEFVRKPLFGEQMRSLQKLLNLTWTMSGKNTVTAGSRERYFTNTQKPKQTVVTKSANGGQVKYSKPGTLMLGGEHSNFLQGSEIYEGEGENRKLVGYADAVVTVVDPVETENFHQQRDKIVFAMRSGAHQSHAEMNDVADLSGKSRQEGRAPFEKSLKRSKNPTDSAGRWIIELGLRFAAAYTTSGNGNQTREKEFEKYRVDFNSFVDTGALDPEQTKDDKADLEDGLMSPEAYLSRRGFEDPEAEIARTKKSEFYKLARKKKMLEVAVLAQQAGFPVEEVLIISGYSEDEIKRLLPLMKAAENEKKITA